MFERYCSLANINTDASPTIEKNKQNEIGEIDFSLAKGRASTQENNTWIVLFRSFESACTVYLY